jgi:16S rRNA (uracil1498-N3)-methyltransferase
MLQSKQCWLPVLREPAPFNSVIVTSNYTQKLIAHCEENSKISILQLPASRDVQVLIGPEGDFTHREIERAIAHNYTGISLGSTRLRTETAAVTAVILLMNHPNKI